MSKRSYRTTKCGVKENYEKILSEEVRRACNEFLRSREPGYDGATFMGMRKSGAVKKGETV